MPEEKKEPKFRIGDRVITGDIYVQDLAVIISGPHKQVTSDLLVYLVKFDGEDEVWCAYEEEIQPQKKEVSSG